MHSDPVKMQYRRDQHYVLPSNGLIYKNVTVTQSKYHTHKHVCLPTVIDVTDCVCSLPLWNWNRCSNSNLSSIASLCSKANSEVFFSLNLQKNQRLIFVVQFIKRDKFNFIFNRDFWLTRSSQLGTISPCRLFFCRLFVVVVKCSLHSRMYCG